MDTPVEEETGATTPVTDQPAPEPQAAPEPGPQQEAAAMPKCDFTDCTNTNRLGRCEHGTWCAEHVAEHVATLVAEAASSDLDGALDAAFAHILSVTPLVAPTGEPNDKSFGDILGNMFNTVKVDGFTAADMASAYERGVRLGHEQGHQHAEQAAKEGEAAARNAETEKAEAELPWYIWSVRIEYTKDGVQYGYNASNLYGLKELWSIPAQSYRDAIDGLIEHLLTQYRAPGVAITVVAVSRGSQFDNIGS